jgi:uncharacterized protein (TIGR04255 family)
MSFGDYADPPVTEVALSIQFQPLQMLRTPHIGLLWQEYREKGLTKVEEQKPLDPAFELFRGDRLAGQVIMTDIPPIPRILFLNENLTQLVQVQQDRFVHNWRRLSSDEEYPRYHKIRRDFLKDLEVFEGFLQERDLGRIKSNQCEITYVNPIVLEENDLKTDDIQKAVTVLNPRARGEFLPTLEDFNLVLSYIIPKEDGAPIGRLHISVRPVVSKDRKQHAFLLELTARGRPDGEGLDGVMKFLDKGHEWIVKGFTSITSETMHERWGLKK